MAKDRHTACASPCSAASPPPPSLQNIFAELQRDVGFQIPDHGCLEKWARQGVLMLNTVLTVREGQPNSHANKGWEILTDQIIRLLDARPAPLVFLLWGRNAKAKQSLLSSPRASHPGHFAPEPLFCQLWLCGLCAFFKDQCLSAGKSYRADRLAALKKNCAHTVFLCLAIIFIDLRLELTERHPALHLHFKLLHQCIALC